MRTWLLLLLLVVLACASWISLSADDNSRKAAEISTALEDL